MKKDWDEQFDATVGLAFSLRAFETYRISGTLSAEVRSVPGIRGHCQAYLEIIEGKIVSCYLVDRTGKCHHVLKDMLINLDEAKGPFNWTFRKTTAPTLATPFPEQVTKPFDPQTPIPEQIARRPTPQTTWFPVPIRLVENLDVGQLQQWTLEHQRYLYMVFSMINGQWGVDEIKERLPLHPAIVDRSIHILLLLHAIAMQ